MSRLFLLATVALGACSFSTEIPDAAVPSVRIGFGEATSTADEKSTTHQIKVTLSDVSDRDVTVKYQIEGGTASPLDFDLLSPETLTIPAGTQETNLEIRVKADTDGTEADETIDLVLLDPMNAQIAFGTEHHEVTIRAKALPRVGFDMATSSDTEPMDGTFIVKLDETSEFEITASYVVTSTNAVAGSDYVLANGMVTFPIGTQMMPITLDVLDDTLDEDPESVVVTLTTATNAVVDLAIDNHTHTILDEGVDPPPTVFFNQAATALGEAGGTAMVQIRLSGPSGRTISVPFAVDNTSSATLTADYTIGTTSPVTIAAGATTANVLVTAVNDTGDEPSETIVINMGAATNATNTGQQTHTVTIADDDLVCYGAAPFSVCLDSPPVGAQTLPATINTTNAALCAGAQTTGWTTAPQSQPAACFILKDTITVNGTVTVSGNRPLVLLGASGVTINGTIDASSNNIAGSTGPASPSGDCDAFGQNPANDGGGAGGGAGGTFMTQGGAGGTGDGGSNVQAGTPAAAETAPVPKLRAGCNGQRGGNGSSGAANASGAVGRGGGAVYVVTGGTLSMTANGVINVSGSAGSGGALFSGGSGAGSGGMIKLYAATLTAVAGARVMANGGGGAAGGDDAGTGNDGNDPDPAQPQTAAGGGTGAGANGGGGFAGATAATKGSDGGNNKGGGGGGGGGGYIQSNLALTNVTTSAGVIQIP